MKTYEGKVAPSGMTFIPNFMKQKSYGSRHIRE